MEGNQVKDDNGWEAAEYFPANEREASFCEWLRSTQRGGYVKAFLSLQRLKPSVLAGLDNQEWQEIFETLSPLKEGQEADLSGLFGNMSI